MKLFRFPWTPVPEDEYIANIRRSIVVWDRWRFWFIPVFAGLLVALFWVVARLIPFLIKMAVGNAPFALLAFAAGATTGYFFGWTLFGILEHLKLVLGGFHSERLLLKYHDALNPEQSADEQPPQPETVFKEL